MFFLEVDPSVVKPGWTPLIITILLAAAIVLLMLSMRRQIRKIRAPHRNEIEDAAPHGPTAAPTDQPTDHRAGDPTADSPAESTSDSQSDSTADSTGQSTDRSGGTDRHSVSQG
ncbi:hypothetical protein [Microlunatus sp. Gsoil 973]|uniref:hypothetical protein n=1 Tax=Microlunatus sp. Gsoil 973 TaxID=2672569 RepID=UPI0012B50342|nr:hypothetical protein [Microlunatus sp. Gsoil 973]QGN33498.1 hypothetical protein GJV80_12525 [Microlunatus sp. Gsoil 973]